MIDVDQSASRGCTDENVVLVGWLLAEREDERRRLARLLHDDVTGMLVAARMDLSRAAGDGTGAEVRQLLHRVDHLLELVIRAARLEMQRLQPALLDHLGLPAALRHLVEESCRARGIGYKVAIDEPFEVAVRALPIAVFRLIEALLEEPGLAQFDLRLRSRRSGHEVVATRRVGPGLIARDARHAPSLATLRHWLRSLGATWTEAGVGEVATVTLRIPAAPPPAAQQDDARGR